MIELFFAVSISVIVASIWYGFWAILHTFINESTYSFFWLVINFLVGIVTVYVGSLFVLFIMLRWTTLLFGVTFQ